MKKELSLYVKPTDLSGDASTSDSTPKTHERIRRFIFWAVPCLTWAPQLTRQQLRTDIAAGCVVGVMLLPQSLSFASLLQMPLQYGLFAALAGTFAYSVFGQTAVVTPGPVAEITTLLLSVQDIAMSEKPTVFRTAAFFVGVLSIAASMMKGGKIIKTVLAKAVSDGYSAAAALLVIVIQTKTMFNVPARDSAVLQEALYYNISAIYSNFSSNSMCSFLLFSLYCGYLLSMKLYFTNVPSWVPHQFIVIIVSTLITYGGQFDQTIGLSIVRSLPSTLPTPMLPTTENFSQHLQLSFVVTLVGFLQTCSIASKAVPSLDADQELFSHGTANLFAGIFQGIPTSCSLSRSGVLMDQKVQTPLTAFCSFLVMLVSIVLFTRLDAFYYLPTHALSAIIVAAVVKLIDFGEPARLMKISKMDSAVWITTFSLTLVGGITVGVLGGILLALLLVILRVARPRTVTIGYSRVRDIFGELREDPELLVYPRILLWRFDAPLYYVNLGYFEERLRIALLQEVRPINIIIINCSRINDVDSAVLTHLPSVIHGIQTIDAACERRVIFAQMQGRVEPVLGNMDPERKMLFFRTMKEALVFAQKEVRERVVYEDKLPNGPRPYSSFLSDALGQALDHRNSTSLVHTNNSTDQRNHNAPSPLLSIDHIGGAVPSSFPTAPHPPHHHSANSLAHVVSLFQHSLFEKQNVSLFDTSRRRMLGMIGVIRHGDITPKQKIKVPFTTRKILSLFTPGAVLLQGKRLNFREVQMLVKAIATLDEGDDDNFVALKEAAVVIESMPTGIKVQIKPFVQSCATTSTTREGDEIGVGDTAAPSQCTAFTVLRTGTAVLICKWGGTLTREGEHQAANLGRALLSRFVTSGDVSLSTMQEWRHHVVVKCIDEERVMQTAIAVTKAITALSEDEVIKDIVRDKETLGAVPAAEFQIDIAKKHLSLILHTKTFCETRRFLHLPGMTDLIQAMSGTSGNHHHRDVVEATPYAVLCRVHELICQLVCEVEKIVKQDNLRQRSSSFDLMETSGSGSRRLLLDAKEPVAEFLKRWQHLCRKFILGTNKEDGSCTFDVSEVPKINDYIAYDAPHNLAVLEAYSPTLGDCMDELFLLVGKLIAVCQPLMMGATKSDRFITGSLIVRPLLRSILNDLNEILLNRPQRRGTIRLYFTQHLHAYALEGVLLGNHRVRGFVSATDEKNYRLNYMTHIVFKLSVNDADDHFIEIFLSTGAQVAYGSTSVADTAEDSSSPGHFVALRPGAQREEGRPHHRRSHGGGGRTEMVHLATVPMTRIHNGLSIQKLEEILAEIDSTVLDFTPPTQDNKEFKSGGLGKVQVDASEEED